MLACLSVGRVPRLAVLLSVSIPSYVAATTLRPPRRGTPSWQTTKALEAAASKKCGVAGILNEEGKYQAPHDMMGLQCHDMMTTNCSVSYQPMKCPTDCEFLAPNNAFSCLFQCVKADACSETNPDRAYPDPENHVCMPCRIAGCKLCVSEDKCKTCHPNFDIVNDGSKCKFVLDEKMHLRTVVSVVGVLLGMLVLLGVCWFAIKGPHPRWEKNMVAILRARRHRHLTKVQEWRLGDTKQVRKWYSLTTNMHKTNVLGVGVPLFYNSICFLVLVSMLFVIVTYAVYVTNDVSSALAKFEHSRFLLEHEAKHPIEQTPAVIMSPLASCGKESASDIMKTLKAFASWNFFAIGFLYVVTLVFSLWFGKFQKNFAKTFDAQNLTMSDYAVRLSGLPVDETDEAELRKWLEDEFRTVCPGTFKRPAEQIRTHDLDEDRPRPDSGIDVFAVSICYDYSEQMNEVHDVMWKLMEQMEVDMHQQAKYDPWQLDGDNTTAAYNNMTLDDVDRENRKKCMVWFEGDKKLKSCGQAFVVFRYVRDKEKVMQYFETKPDFLKHPKAPNQAVKLGPVFSEPPTIAWWFAGVSEQDVMKRTMRNVFYILLMIAAVQMFIILPYAWFILWPYSQTGRAAGGMKMTIAGIVLGNINGILFMTNYNTAAQVGYHRKDELDEFVLFTNTILVLVNTGLNIFTTAFMVIKQHDADYGVSGFLEIKFLRAIGTENSLAMNVYNMMMPGSFFTGLVLAMIMAGWVPFVVNTFLMKVIYIWKCLPDRLLVIIKVFLPWAPPGLDHYPFRSAEKAFDPWEVPICGNYADHIVTPTIAFCMLFCLSPYVWNTFLGMLAWACFEYCYFRYMHLRYHKACYYTTHRLDSFSLYLWGLPLSVVAAAWCLWGLRAERLLPGSTNIPLKFALVFIAFILSNILWLVCYHYLVRPFKLEDADEENDGKTVEEVKAETVYSWLNCNPPFVLKCKYYYKDDVGKFIEKRRQGHPIACGEDPEEVRFFEVGKQYLFIKPKRQMLVNDDTHNPFEYETHFEKAIYLFDVFANLCKKRSRQQLARIPEVTNVNPYSLLETRP